MLDFDFEIARLRKNLPPPKSFSVPFSTVDQNEPIESKSSSIERRKSAYDFASFIFSTQNLIYIFSYTQRRYQATLLEWAMELFEQERIPIGSFALRAFFESAAHFIDAEKIINKCFDKHKKINKVSESDVFPEGWIESISSIYEEVVPLVIPFTLDVDKIKTKSGSFLDNETITRKSDLLSPPNIAKKLEKLEKEVTGLRPTYDFLCEYVHPNSFALMSFFTSGYSDKEWVFDTKPKDIVGVREVISKQISKTLNETVNVVLAKDKNLQFLHRNLVKETRKIVRPYIKMYDLSSDDRFANKHCPCGGDKLFNSCCAK